MPGVFISYRRGRTSAYAGRLYDRLAAEFGEENVFMDLAAIDPGVDFVSRIERAVGEADALLVVIGPDWIDVTDDQGRRRLEDPDDFVRQEVARALERDTLVVPVLVDGATMPATERLPEPVRSLGRRNALELTNVAWSRDVDRLMQVLRQRLGGALGRRQSSRLRRPATLAALAIGCIVAAAAIIALLAVDGDGPRSGSGLRIRSEVPVGGTPQYAATTGGKVWVALFGEGLLKSFSPGSQAVRDSPRLGTDLSGLAAADGRLFAGAYGATADDGRGEVVEVNPKTGQPRGRPIKSTDPFEIATDGRSLWVTDIDTVQVIDLRTRETREVDFNGQAFGVAVDGGKAWVVDNDDGRLHSYDARTGRGLGRPIEVGAGPFSVAAAGRFVWVATDQGSLVRVPAAGGAGRTLTVGGEGRRVVAADERSVWVVDIKGNVVLVDPRSFEIRGRLRLPGDLQDVAVDGGGAWVTVARSNVPSTVVRVVRDPEG